MASAETRPEVKYSVPVKVRMEGSTALRGPIRVHVASEGDAAEVVAADVRLWMFSKAARAFKVAENGISVAG